MPLYKVTKKEIKETVYYTTAWDNWWAQNKVANGEVKPFGEEEVSVEIEAVIPPSTVEDKADEI